LTRCTIDAANGSVRKMSHEMRRDSVVEAARGGGVWERRPAAKLLL
jgi:hypothetical protein